MTIEQHVLIKLGISAILGLIIGLERELKHKPVGLKTSLVICIVSCLLTTVSIESAYLFEKTEQITMDPLRLAAQIVSGIGFLGAGVILRRGNDSISGLTTAAMIWGAAGIGITVGAGFFIEAISGVVLLIISVEFLPFIVRLCGPKKLREKEILLQLKVSEHHHLTDIISDIKKSKAKLTHIRIKDLETNEQFIQLKLMVPQKKPTTEVYYEVRKIDGVRSIEIENL